MSTEAKCQENHYEEMLENEPMARTRVVKLCFPPHIQNRVSPLVSQILFFTTMVGLGFRPVGLVMLLKGGFFSESA